ncbi:MAG: ABC transporter permease subunit [bacterium]|nr:ABC transporter permease subunit [bacterium]MYA38265.1 ABC transporter permease subunit [Acidimicrobiia bacterium]MDE0131040.1 ABC transporter permease subunit [bacterium]MDE0673462.1 ABC transporter permease subunit [bacterium]MYB78602.1 ABC transporter permease subunit [Acidimicrobiia bacterium]
MNRFRLSERGAERLSISVLLAPAVAVIVLLFLGGLASGFLRSLNYFPLIGLNDFNFDAYFAIFTDNGFLQSLVLTFHIAFTSTLIASILAVASALLLRPAFRGKRIVHFFFSLNLTIPHLVGAIGVLYLFQNSGLVSRIMTGLDLIQRPADFPAMVFDPWAIGIIIQYVWKEIPFIGVIVLAILLSVGEDYESVARSLGANRWQAFRQVTLPLIMPGVVSASVIVFAFTFGAFEIPYLLGRTFPAALPVLAYQSYTDVDLAARPQAMAMAMVIAFISTLLIMAYMKLSRVYIRE